MDIHCYSTGRFLMSCVPRIRRRSAESRSCDAHASVDGDIPIADEGAFIDIDTTEDYTREVISAAAIGDRAPRRQES